MLYYIKYVIIFGVNTYAKYDCFLHSTIKKFFQKKAGLSRFYVVLCCADRKGGTPYEKSDKRAMVWKYNADG